MDLPFLYGKANAGYGHVCHADAGILRMGILDRPTLVLDVGGYDDCDDGAVRGANDSGIPCCEGTSEEFFPAVRSRWYLSVGIHRGMDRILRHGYFSPVVPA
jgi:hypothetical protein